GRLRRRCDGADHRTEAQRAHRPAGDRGEPRRRERHSRYRRCGEGRARRLHARHCTSTTHVTAPIFNTKLPFDPIKDFTPVAVVGISPYVLVVSPKLPVNTVADLVALAKAKPGTISYSSVGEASQAYLAMELFSAKTGAEFNHIPYKT